MNISPARLQRQIVGRFRKHFWRRFLRDKRSLFSLTIILLGTILAILGYLIAPDSTPNANDGNVQIKLLPPGSQVQIIKRHRNIEVEKRGWLGRMLWGQESPYAIIPVDTFYIEGWYIYYKPYQGKSMSVQKSFEQLHLVNAVKALFVGEHPRFKALSKEGNFIIKGEEAAYLGVDGKIYRTTRQQLIDTFVNEQVEMRYFLLGTDRQGRDIVSRLIVGFRVSLLVGLFSVLISALVGVLLGAIAGFLGGWVDNLIMIFITVVWSIPSIMLVIAISLALQSKGLWVTFLAIGLTNWVEVARLTRGLIMSIKAQLYIVAAKAIGASRRRILLRHILPNILGIIMIHLSGNFAYAILTEAGLSFLGLGVQPPTPSWGMMVSEGYETMGISAGSHLLWAPSICIFLTVLAFNLLGNSLRDAIDPTHQKHLQQW